MNFEMTAMEGVVKIVPPRYSDQRGYFSEIFKESWFRKEIADIVFLQDNESLSIQAGTIRGLHFQTPPFAQGKLVRCSQGAIFDVVVDIRRKSKSFGHWLGEELTPENGTQLWVPAGFAHGFVTLKDDSVISYKVTAPYSPNHDFGIAWDDPAIGIEWPVQEKDVVLSEKDRNHPKIGDLPFYF